MKICVSGLTASGKTTLATALQAQLGFPIFRSSSYRFLPDAPLSKKERLLAWLTQTPEQVVSPHDQDNDRCLDREVVNTAKRTTTPLIFESLTLPFLSRHPNNLFSILLLASEERRAQRLVSLFPELHPQQCQTIIHRKDERTQRAMAAAWNVTLYETKLYPFYDLILKEDDHTIPLEPTHIATIVMAAIRVYQGYQTKTSELSYADSLASFRQITTTMASSISFAHPLLLTDALPSPDIWYHRR